MKKIICFVLPCMMATFNLMANQCLLYVPSRIPLSELSEDEVRAYNSKAIFDVFYKHYRERDSNDKGNITAMVAVLLQKILQDKGASFNVDYQNEDGLTLLHLALKYKDVSRIKFLVEKLGANCQLLNNEGYSPLVLALQNLGRANEQLQGLPYDQLRYLVGDKKMYETIVKIFKKSSSMRRQKQPRYYCIPWNDPENWKNGTPIYDDPAMRSESDPLSRSSLHVVGHDGDLETLERWLCNDFIKLSDIRQQDLLGNTPLMSILEFVEDPIRAYKMARLLIDNGAHLHAINVSGVRAGDLFDALEERIEDLQRRGMLTPEESEELDLQKISRRKKQQDLDEPSQSVTNKDFSRFCYQLAFDEVKVKHADKSSDLLPLEEV